MNYNNLVKSLQEDGWILDGQRGSHRYFKHPVKTGKVTVPYHGNNKELHPKTVKSILKQAGL